MVWLNQTIHPIILVSLLFWKQLFVLACVTLITKNYILCYSENEQENETDCSYTI